MQRLYFPAWCERLESRRLLSTLQVVYASGDPVPGLPGEAFDSFDDGPGSSAFSQFNNHGDMAFVAFTTAGSGNDRRIGRFLFGPNAAGATVPILNLLTTAPGAPGRVIRNISNLILTNSRKLIFQAQLGIGAPGSAQFAGNVIYEWDGISKLTILASDTAGLPGNNINWYGFAANAGGSIVLSGTKGVAEISPTGTIITRAAPGAAAPGGGTFASNFSPAEINDSGQIAFYDTNLYEGDGKGGLRKITSGFFPEGLAPELNNRGDLLYFNPTFSSSSIHAAQANGTMRLVAQAGQSAPGTGGTFANVSAPSLAADGSVAFSATVETGQSNLTGEIWRADANGTLHHIVSVGDPTLVGDGGAFITLSAPVINASDQVAFEGASTMKGGVFATNPSGKVVPAAPYGAALLPHLGLLDSIDFFERIDPELNDSGEISLDVLGYKQQELIIYHSPTAPAPDLSAALSAPVAKNAKAGNAIVTKLKISNLGNGPAVGTEVIDYYLSSTPTLSAASTLIGTQSQALQLAAGLSTIQTSILTIPGTTKAGAYYLIARANADGAIYERDSANPSNDSIVGGPLQITASPDLSGTFSAAPAFHAFWYAGGKESFTLVIKNSGGGAATGTIGIDYYLSPTSSLSKTTAKNLLSTSMALNLTAGQSSASIVNSILIPQNTALGTYYLIADIDHAHVSGDANLSNNAAASTALCLCSSVALDAGQAALYDTAIRTAKKSPAPPQQFGSDLAALDSAAARKIQLHEAFVPFPYIDAAGQARIGKGTLVSANAQALTALHLDVAQLIKDAKANGQVTGYVTVRHLKIGTTCSGRGASPLEPSAISDSDATTLLSGFEKVARAGLAAGLAPRGVTMSKLPGNVQVALIDMSYSLGIAGFFNLSAFISDIATKTSPNYGCAGYEMFQTAWAEQVTTRAVDDYLLLISALSPSSL
jgi:hypothetical protein